jgi:Nickel responsive protein SCO4226-like
VRRKVYAGWQSARRSTTGCHPASQAQKSLTVLREMGPEIQWLQSYVTGDKIYCVYLAPGEAMIRAHAKQGGFPRKSSLCSSPSHRPNDCRLTDLSTPGSRATGN